MEWLRRWLQRWLPSDDDGEHELGIQEAQEAQMNATERVVRKELLKREIKPMLARMQRRGHGH
jgi:hypothetical protein